MRIVRYELEITDYQQLQPLWPGRILSIAPGRTIDPRTGMEIPNAHRNQKIDVWGIDNSDSPNVAAAPVLGVWIIGTGNPMPDGTWPGIPALDPDALFHGTAVMLNGLVWHVFSAIVGEAPTSPQAITARSVDDMAEQIAARHRKGRA